MDFWQHSAGIIMDLLIFLPFFVTIKKENRTFGLVSRSGNDEVNINKSIPVYHFPYKANKQKTKS